MKTISVSQFKALCLGLLEKVSKTGQPILITKNGRPLAQVLPPLAVKSSKPWLGSMKGTAHIKGDITAPACEVSDWEVLK